MFRALQTNSLFATPGKTRSAVFQLHLATFLFGLAGVIGRATALSPLILVEARAGFAALTLLCVAGINGISLRIHRAQRLRFVLIGLLLAFHWYSFFLAIQSSGVTVGLLTFSCFPVFVILLAPHIDKSGIKKRDFVLVVVLMLGLWLIMPQGDLGGKDMAGAIWGLASGFSFAIIQIINRSLVQNNNPIKICVYQNSIAALILLPLAHQSVLPNSWGAFGQLLFLGLVCTALAHTLFIMGMRSISAQTASMFVYLEPVYGICTAALLLKEIPDARTLSGGLVILATIFFSSRST